MKWRVLGPVEAVLKGEPLPISRPQLRAVLAYLVLNGNVAVPVEQLTEALWSGAAPASARTQIQVCISQLRKLIRDAGQEPEESIVSGAGGYRLTVDDEDVDARVFASLIARAREHAHAGEPEPATILLRQGLALWRGPALAGAAAAFVAPAAANLHDEKLTAYEDLFDAEFALGRHAAAIAPLRELVAENPWRERLTVQLMTAFARLGYQAEALRAYERTRRRLADELGVEPGARLAETHLSVLRQQLTPARPAPAAGWTGPAQLPADLSSFTGRDDALAALGAMLSRARKGNATAVVAIVGTAGVGKTALAIKWAHRVRHSFGDGQLFLDLAGYSPGPPLPALEALSRCLRALGVAPAQVPDDIDEASGIYRSLLADRRMLILLDNARDTAHIQHLLPGGAGCLVIVTSRGRLDGLVTKHDAQRLPLEVFTADEARGLLVRLIGSERVAGQCGGVAELGVACARLPLALRIAAADLHNRPHETVSGYVTRLSRGDPLDILAVSEDEQLAVRHAFAVSYGALAARLQRLFRLFGVVPGCDVTAESAAAMLCGTTTDEATGMLSGLAEAHLVQEHDPGRFSAHDLLSLYAARLAEAEDNRQALGRLLSWYLFSVREAADRLCPQVLRLPPPAWTPPIPPPRFGTHVEALAWLDAHRHNLVLALRYATREGLHAHVWSLADALRGYLWLGMHTTEWAEVARLGLTAAHADGNHQAQAAARLSLGALNWRLEHFAAAMEDYRLALDSARHAAWPDGQAAALGNLGPVLRMSGKPGQALRVLEEALSLNLFNGWAMGAGVNHNNLGLVCFDLGRLDESAKHHLASLAVARETGSVTSEALGLTNLGTVYDLLGRTGEAFQTLTRALALHEQTGSRGRAATLCALSRIHAQRGDRPHATKLALEALDMARAPAEPRLEAIALLTLGLFDNDPGRLLEALSRARHSGDRYVETDILTGLAEIDEPAALTWSSAALAIARECGYRVLEGRALAARAQAQHRSGDTGGARHSARLAWESHTATGHRPGALRVESLLTRLGEGLGARKG